MGDPIKTCPPRDAQHRNVLKKRGKRARWKEGAIKSFFFANGLLAVIVLIGIFGLLLSTAIPAFKEIPVRDFLTGKTWDPTSPEKAQYGILSMIVSTLMVTVGALMIAIPLGLGVAAYLSDVAHWKVREVVKPVVEILAGIPPLSSVFWVLSSLAPLSPEFSIPVMASMPPTAVSFWPSWLYQRSLASPKTL